MRAQNSQGEYQMRLFKTLTAAVIIASAAGAVSASPFNSQPSIDALSDALYATVLPVNQGEAKALKIDVDTAALQAQIKNNRALSRAVEAQGYSVENIVGLDSLDGGAYVTLYAL
jgi:hypothetical protein